MPQDLILVRPRRGHQSRHLGRWVQYGEDAYECPVDEAARLIRHKVVARVDEDDASEEHVADAVGVDGVPDADPVDDEEVTS